MRSLRVALVPLAFAAVACGGSPPPAPSPPSADKAAPSPTAAPESAKGPDDAAVIEALTSKEAKDDACDPDHKAALEKLLDAIETSVRAKTDDGKPLTVESFSKRVLPLSDAARGFSLKLTGKGKEVHVLAYSAKEVSLDALAGNAAATTMRSPYQRDVVEGGVKLTVPKTSGPVALESDSRQIEMKPGQELEVRLRGQGCAGVVVFSK